MIIYDPGKWSIQFAFSLAGSVFPKAIVFALPCSASAVLLHWLFNVYSQESKDKAGAGDVGATVLGGFTFVLGFLVVFRSQKGYDRWWEGGTLLQQIRGEWFNAYSCLLAFSNHAPEKRDQVLHFQHKLVRMISLLYSSALAQVATLDNKDFEVIDLDNFDPEGLKYLQSEECHDRCEVVLQWLQKLIVEAEQQGLVKIAPPILSRVYQQLGNGIVGLNNARKITDFPIPFPLAQMITFMLFFHLIVTPVICATSIKSIQWAGILSFAVSLSYWSINYIAVELEQPFGDDPNDLPLHDMQRDLNCSLKQLFDKRCQHIPTFNFNKERHEKLHTIDIDFEHFDFEAYGKKAQEEDAMNAQEVPETQVPVANKMPSDPPKPPPPKAAPAPEPPKPAPAPDPPKAPAPDPPKAPAPAPSSGTDNIIGLLDKELIRLNTRMEDHLAKMCLEIQAMGARSAHSVVL